MMSESPTASSSARGLPLAVDLDGTLLKTDLLFESLVLLLKENPLLAFFLPIWLLKGGKANLKYQIAERVELDAKLIPLRNDLLEYIAEQRRSGRTIILATATQEKLAKCMADHLGVFDAVIASDPETNLKGQAKRQALLSLFGERGFDYAGNDHSDLEIWKHANGAILVGVSRRILDQVKRSRIPVLAVFTKQELSLRTCARALRIHQWTKNLLIFVPIIAAHQLADLALLLKNFLAFAAFSLCASSVYLLNDMFDLAADRQHPSKKKRPFACGEIGLDTGAVAVTILLALAFSVAVQVGPEFLLLLLGYFILTVLYTFKLKKVVLVDVMLLASLYTMRVLGGGVATGIQPSFWLLSFSMFLFLSLAMMKRCAELMKMCQIGDGSPAGRGYISSDLATLSSLGIASGYLSVLVLALYLHSEHALSSYSHPRVLWLVLPFYLYWISRMWMAAARGKMHDDPLVYALTERVNQWIWLLAVLLLILGF